MGSLNAYSLPLELVFIWQGRNFTISVLTQVELFLFSKAYVKLTKESHECGVSTYQRKSLMQCINLPKKVMNAVRLRKDGFPVAPRMTASLIFMGLGLSFPAMA